MAEHKSTFRELARGAERGFLHIGAIAVGFILMIVALAMGVSVVMLPLGITVGLAGLAILLWGIFGRAQPPREKQ